MTGDGTNDAPALAQADVGVAMNTGTQAAKEAGNMVDLDSNPTKLIEIVEIGKQLLITRGSLTTFSIANDVAKYFAIIPAMFQGVFPQLKTLNIMKLDNPHSAILSAVIFNALIIVVLIPLALRGVKFRADGRGRRPAAQPADLRRGRRDRPVHRHQAHRPRSSPPWGCTDARASSLTGLLVTVVLTVLLGGVYPLAVWGVGQVAFHDQANGSFVKVDGKVVGSSLIGQNFTDKKEPAPAVLPAPAVGGRQGRLRPDERGNEPRAVEPQAHPTRPAAAGASTDADATRSTAGAPTRCPSGSSPTAAQRAAADAPVPVDAVTASASGLDPHISVANARSRRAAWRAPAGLDVDRCSSAGRAHTHGAQWGSWVRRRSTCWSSTSPSTAEP